MTKRYKTKKFNRQDAKIAKKAENEAEAASTNMRKTSDNPHLCFVIVG